MMPRLDGVPARAVIGGTGPIQGLDWPANDDSWRAVMAAKLWGEVATAAILQGLKPSPQAALAAVRAERRLVRFLNAGALG